MVFNPWVSHNKDLKNSTWYLLYNTKHSKVRIKGKEEQSKVRSSAP